MNKMIIKVIIMDVFAYLRPPEKWSLFGRTKLSMWVNINPFKTSGGGIRYLYIKWIWKSQNGCKQLPIQLQLTRKKRDIPERMSLYKELVIS